MANTTFESIGIVHVLAGAHDIKHPRYGIGDGVNAIKCGYILKKDNSTKKLTPASNGDTIVGIALDDYKQDLDTAYGVNDTIPYNQLKSGDLYACLCAADANAHYQGDEYVLGANGVLDFVAESTNTVTIAERPLFVLYQPIGVNDTVGLFRSK